MRANKIRDLLVDNYCEDENVFLELEELVKLARIGEATKKALEHESVLIIDYFFWNGACEGEYEVESTEQLLEWYEREGDNERL